MTFAGTVATVTFNGPVHTGDIIYGNEGNDTIFGGAGDDFITGGAGNNSIIAGSGNDLIFGGFPWINSATGNPYDYGTLYQLIYVGDSINLLGLTPNLSQFTLSWNGAATNSITYTGTPQDVTNIQNALSSLSGIGAGGATVYVSGTGYDSVYHVVFSSSVNWINQNLTVAVSSGPGTGYVGAAPHYLSSSDPSQMPDGPYTLFLDSYDGAANDGNNIIQGGAGNSLIFGGAGNDTITGGTGNAYIDGGAGNDIISGGPGPSFNILRGGAGDDIIHAGAGIDQVYGDAGDDTLFAGPGLGNLDSTNIQAGERLFGGEGNDTLYAWAPVYVTAQSTDLLQMGDALFGGPGDDFLYGNVRSDFLSGDGGDDTIYGDGVDGRASPSAEVNSVMINPHPDSTLPIASSIQGAPHLDSEMWEAKSASESAFVLVKELAGVPGLDSETGVASSASELTFAPVKELACRMNRRNTVSVTPAIGASTVAGRTSTVPMRTSAGTRASAGITCSTGLSQFFFTVNPRRAIVTF